MRKRSRRPAPRRDLLGRVIRVWFLLFVALPMAAVFGLFFLFLVIDYLKGR